MLEFLSEDSARTLTGDSTRTFDIAEDVSRTLDLEGNFRKSNKFNGVNSDNNEEFEILKDFTEQESDIRSWSSTSKKTTKQHERKSSTGSKISTDSRRSQSTIDNNDELRIVKQCKTSKTGTDSKQSKLSNSFSTIQNKKRTPIDNRKIIQQSLTQQNSKQYKNNKSVENVVRQNDILTLKRENAAKYIQVWWQKVRIRKTAGAAAMRRMMENKQHEMKTRLSVEREKVSTSFLRYIYLKLVLEAH